MKNKIMHTLFKSALSVILILALSASLYSQQMADPGFNASVDRPSYTRKHPKVVIDEAHSNFHTTAGRYKPFADLLRSDGYEVLPGTEKFRKENLKGVDVLVIANAAPATQGVSVPAFSEQECDVVRDWVRAGGSLLLIADHAPFGGAAENLAKRFGVGMGNGFVFDLANSVRTPTTLIFSKENGLLGSHPLLRGRNPSEEVKRLIAFTGQSLVVPAGAVALMKLSPTAYESPNRDDLQTAVKTDSKRGTDQARPAIGRAQALAMKFGKGKVVVLGEAAMFSAQIVRLRQGEQLQEMKMGMNVAGSDDKQFALNVLHWLSGLLK